MRGGERHRAAGRSRAQGVAAIDLQRAHGAAVHLDGRACLHGRCVERTVFLEVS